MAKIKDVDESVVQMAEQLATCAHAWQERRDRETPYISHPKKVAQIVTRNDEKACAWLHDTIEDTDTTKDILLAAGIPEHIVEAVVVLTHKDSEPYQEYLERVKGDKLATKVKVADMVANLTDKPTDRQIKKYTKGMEFLLDKRAG